MDILGVGPLELFFIIIIALIVLGPRDMIKAGHSLGRMLRKIITSPTWRTVQQTSRDFRNLPNRLIREAGLEEEMEDLKKIKGEVEKMGVEDITQEAQNINRELSDVNADLKKTQKQLVEAQKDLSAWTTPPLIESPAPPVVTKTNTSRDVKDTKTASEQPKQTEEEVAKEPTTKNSTEQSASKEGSQ
jgi:Sec-independent protein translocase protein TatA